jgi:AcrR family transcriptional regulator
VRTQARRGEGQRLREEILDAADRLLVATGDEEAVSIRAIATEVGVTPGAIYLHFADKAELLFAVCERTFATLDDTLERAVAGIDDPLASLHARGAAYIRFGVENPDHYRILFMGRPGYTPADWGNERLAKSAAFRHLVEAVASCQAAGVLAPALDPELAAVGLWTTVHGVASLVVARPDFPWPPLERLIDHVLAAHAFGIAVQPQASDSSMSS